MRKSDYTYDFLNIDTKVILVIYDQDLGNASVTNNMENVLLEIEAESSENIEDCLIMYRDSRGIYDGIRRNNNQITFHPIGETDREEAIKELISQS